MSKKNRVGSKRQSTFLLFFLALCVSMTYYLFFPLSGVAEQFALAEAAMNAWSTQDIENQATAGTIPLQGIIFPKHKAAIPKYM